MTTQHTLSKQAPPPPPPLSRMGALIELPALNAPFRDNRGGGGAYLKRVHPSPFSLRSRLPPFRHKPSGTVANWNALDAYFYLNDVKAKFLDRSANIFE